MISLLKLGATATVEVDGQHITGTIYHVRANGWPCVETSSGRQASGPIARKAPPVISEYSGLWATALSPEQHARTCGYWYTVTDGAMAHTAFATRAGLDRWLSERGLSLESSLPDEAGEWASTRIIGSYRARSYLRDADEFARVHPIAATAVMSNGDYTLGLITEDDGVRTIHYLNPNVRSRLVFDYWATRKVMS